MFSITYVKYYQHKREKEFGSTMVTTLALTTVRCRCLTIYLYIYIYMCIYIYVCVCIIKNKKDIQGRWTLLACLYDEIYRPNVVSWHAVLLPRLPSTLLQPCCARACACVLVYLDSKHYFMLACDNGEWLQTLFSFLYSLMPLPPLKGLAYHRLGASRHLYGVFVEEQRRLFRRLGVTREHCFDQDHLAGCLLCLLRPVTTPPNHFVFR